MLQPYREVFNRNFTAEQYATLQQKLAAATHTPIEFRVAETPVFFQRAMLDEIAAIGIELTHQLVDSPEYMRVSAGSIPAKYNVRNESPQPHFMTVDFGLVRDAEGTLKPRLVEMQAFPSIFGYQDVLSREYIDTYHLDPSLNWYLGGHGHASYWELLRKVIVADHEPKHVVLMEVEPETQKTLPDFKVYVDRLGIVIVDIAKIRQQGRQLFYQDASGKWIRIARIFNRAIVDEIERKQIQLAFDPTADLDVEWAGHPNWFFRISKFSLPYLDHPAVPKAVFLDDWFRNPDSTQLPADRTNILLKPLYSFAGKGIQFAPTDEELNSIPETERSLYLLQERVFFEPVVDTPFGLTQAEIRVMYLWPDGGTMEPVISLVRMGRGLMMGVDHNRNQEWVGGSAALFPG